MSTTAPALNHASMTRVPSNLLGSLEVSPDELIAFPAGLVGLPEYRSFVLIRAAREGMFWLQSADVPDLTFLLVDPFPHFDGYAVELSPEDVSSLEAEDAADVLLLAIVTLPCSPGGECTANLQGPLAFNLRSGRGKQIAIPDPRFGVRCPIGLDRPDPK